MAYRDLCAAVLATAELPHYIEHRTKSLKSFMRKAAELEHEYRDPVDEMNDICGLRITVASLGDADAIWNLLKQELDVDEGRSFDKGADFPPDQFGYRSKHLICRVDSRRRQNREWINHVGWVEIQIRTACQHAWAQVDRLVRYKTAAELPVDVQRRLFSLAAVLEVCDSEIESVLEAWQKTLSSASASIRRSPDTSLTAEIFAAFVETAPEMIQLSAHVNSLGIRLQGLGHLRRDIAILSKAGVSTVSQLEAVMQEAMPWSLEFFEKFLHELRRVGLLTDTLEKNALVTLLVIASRTRFFDEGVLRERFAYGLGWAALAAAPE